MVEGADLLVRDVVVEEDCTVQGSGGTAFELVWEENGGDLGLLVAEEVDEGQFVEMLTGLFPDNDLPLDVTCYDEVLLVVGPDTRNRVTVVVVSLRLAKSIHVNDHQLAI